MVERHLSVSVVFDTSTDPIGGRMSSDGGERPFTGWLGLISGLEHTLEEWHENRGRDHDANTSPRSVERRT
jgi:hypothetical protein